MKQDHKTEERQEQKSVQMDAVCAFLWARVLRGRIGSETAALELFAEQGLRFASDRFAVLIIMPESYGSLEGAEGNGSVLGLAPTRSYELIRDRLRELLPDGPRIHVVDAEPVIVGVINFIEEGPAERTRLEAAISMLKAELRDGLGMELSTAQSRTTRSLFGINHCYEMAYEQLELARVRYQASMHRPVHAVSEALEIGPPGSELLARKRQFLNCLLCRDYANARRLALWMAEGDTREMSSYKEFLARRDNLTFDLVLALEQLVPGRDYPEWNQPYRLIMQLSESRNHAEYGARLAQIFDCFESLNSDAETSARSEKLRQTMRYIHDNISDPGLSVADIAAQVQLSGSQLTRLMQASQGMGTQEYIQQSRIALAKRYLVETELSVSEISRIVGYYSFKTMNCAFKKLVGMTGYQYREQNASLNKNKTEDSAYD